MRNLVFFMHSSLDGFVAGLNGEMNWISFDEDLFDFVGTMTDQADTALYGRVTYEMMQNYWPNAEKKTNATKHEKHHSAWYNQVAKIVLSKTLNENKLEKTKVISDDLSVNINRIKNQEGKNILIFGSPRASHSLLSLGLIDEFWVFVNPVLLGQGIPLFKNVNEITKLKLQETKTFSCGVIALHYKKAEVTEPPIV